MSQGMVANNERIAKNTMLLYFRMGIAMVVGLYTSRLLLQALGITDYGISNVIGGLVSMFSIISGSLTAAISRFLTFELGKNDIKRLTSIFSTSVIIQVVLAFVVMAICELAGAWFLENHLVIPQNRMSAAWWVFHLSIISFGVNLFSVPYGALIVAHERMSIYAYIGLLSVFVNLVTTIVIFYAPCDKLILWAVLGFLVSMLTQGFYWWYCKKNFEECKVHRKSVEKSLLKEIFSFAGWNFIGASAAILRDQGVNIVLNIFCGPAVNAARGVAMIINGKVGQFTNSFTIAVNPQITKSYAIRDYKVMLPLMYRSSRFSYYLFFVLALPIVLNIDMILNLWLKEVPDYSQNFVILILIYSLLETISQPLVVAMLATGKIRNYQLIVGGIQLLNLPLSYLCLKLALPVEYVFVVAIVCSVLCLGARLVMLRSIMPFSAIDFCSSVLLKIALVTIMGMLLPFIVYNLIPAGYINLAVTTAFSLLWSSLVALYIGCTNHEREVILNKALSMINRVIKRINDKYN